MKDLVITVNEWNKNENNEFSTLSTIIQQLVLIICVIL